MNKNDKTKARQNQTQKRPLPKAKAAERGTRIQRQRRQKLDTILANLPSQCDIGAKRNSRSRQSLAQLQTPPRRRRRPNPHLGPAHQRQRP
ncbi:MAG: hypothetical protein M9913_23535 [Bryobacteraceae bacterium]|nr:hypothetical protein [Bryobacteraceae bacterium]